MEGQLVEGQTQIVSTGTEDPVEEKKKWWDQPMIIMGLIAVFVVLLIGLVVALDLF